MITTDQPTNPQIVIEQLARHRVTDDKADMILGVRWSEAQHHGLLHQLVSGLARKLMQRSETNRIRLRDG